MPNPPSAREQAALKLALVAMNIRNGDIIKDDIERLTEVTELVRNPLLGMTESEAMSLLWEMERTFGWTGTMFTEGDLESIWAAELDDRVELAEHGEPAAMAKPFDEVRELFTRSWVWRKGLEEILTERGNEMIVDLAVDVYREATEEDKNG